MIMNLKDCINGPKYHQLLINEKHKNKKLIELIQEIVEHVNNNPKKVVFDFNKYSNLLKNVVDYEKFITAFKSVINKLYDQVTNNEQIILDKNDKILILEERLSHYEPSAKYKEVDSKHFLTRQYKYKFEECISSLSYTEKELVEIFNTLINEDSIYIKGLYSAIDYCKNLKNKKKAMYVQLQDYYLTDNGKQQLKNYDK